MKREDGEKSKKLNKETPKTHRNSDDDIIGIVGKISIRQIQQHQRRFKKVNRVSHMSCPKVLWLTCFWWNFLMSLYLSCWDLFNGTGAIIVRVLVCFYFFSFLSLSPLSLLNVLSINFAIWNNCRWYLRLTNLRSHLRFSKLYYFLNIFCTILSFIFFTNIEKNSSFIPYIEFPPN